MKKLLSVLAILSMLVVAPFWGWCYTEGTKTLQVPGTEDRITIPEKAPEPFDFPTQIMGATKFPNGNAAIVTESLNEALTVDVVMLIVKVGSKVQIVGMIVIYCSEGFDKFDMNKKHDPEVFEDVQFMQTGKFSGKLSRVNKPTDFALIEPFLAKVEI